MKVTETTALAREIAVQVEAFAKRVHELRSLLQRDSSAGSSSPESLRQTIRLQEAELSLAVEELRAQNDALIESQELLETERAKYAELFDNASDAYVTTDGRGVVLEANIAAATLLSMPRHAMARKLLIGFVARRDTRAFRSILKALHDKPRDTFSLNLRPRGGPPFRASLSTRRVRRAPHGAFELCWTIRRSEGTSSVSSGD